MNKIYLSAMAVAFAGSSFAQQAVTKDGNALRDGFMPIHGAQHHNSQINTDDRAVAVWSEDFEGPNVSSEWTLTDNSSPAYGWTIGNAVSPVPTHGGELASTTGNANGATGNIAWINSDGQGDGATQDATLQTTNGIDLSSYTQPLTLRFQQYWRKFNDTHTVGVSIDNGATWTEWTINDGLGNSTNSPNPDYFSVDISAAIDAGGGVYSNNVLVRFNYQGAWGWFWYLDDIEIVETPNHEVDMIVSRYGNAVAENIWGDHVDYAIIPEAQAGDVVALYEAKNKGLNTETNVTFSTDFDGSIVNGMMPTATLAIGDTARDTSAAYTLSGAAPYTVNVTHNLAYDSIALDDETFNNTNTQSFDVDANLYAADNGILGGGSWNGAGNQYSFAAMYQIQNAATLTAVRISVNNSTSAVGTEVYPIVIEMDPAAADFQGLFSNIVYDGSLLGQTYALTSADVAAGASPVWVDLELIGATTPGLALDAGKNYAVGFGVVAGTGDVVINTSTKTALDAHFFLYDAVGNNANSSVQWFWVGSSAMIRANFDSNLGELASINDVETGLTLGQNMPNPANGVTNINYSIANTNNVSMTIVDVTGKVVKTINEGNKGAGEYTISVDTEEFSKGVYFYTLTAGNQKLTNRMIVTK